MDARMSERKRYYSLLLLSHKRGALGVSILSALAIAIILGGWISVVLTSLSIQPPHLINSLHLIQLGFLAYLLGAFFKNPLRGSLEACQQLLNRLERAALYSDYQTREALFQELLKDEPPKNVTVEKIARGQSLTRLEKIYKWIAIGNVRIETMGELVLVPEKRESA